jgi:hypothetical protein
VRSARSTNLGLSIYKALCELMRELEGVGGAPWFQHIVMTTSRPPVELVSDDCVRLNLKGAPAEARLLERNL